jgi:NAD+ synthase (glutamine-hydrolysing)
MNITIAQLNYHIGNFEYNKIIICNAIEKARADGSELVIFSELCIPGYPPLDLLDRIDFIEKCNAAVSEIAEFCKGITAIVGSPVFNTYPEGKKLYNSALVLSEGKILFRTNKALLSARDTFDEYRYFEPGTNSSIFSFKGIKIALTIGEDLRDVQPFDNEFEKSGYPMDDPASYNPDMIINISASPFSHTRIESRKKIFTSKAARHGIPVVTVNQTGANTELIFDGASLIINGEGKIYHQLPYFEEMVFSFSLDDLAAWKNPSPEIRHDPLSLIRKALVTGIRDYFRKTGVKKCIAGLSGGIDSVVVLCLAREALGPENVKALLLPSRYSSDHSVSDSIELAHNLGIGYEIISIEKAFSSFLETLEPYFRNCKPDVTEENIQARIRAILLMAFANKFGAILLNTSNKSEAAVGYGTLYGDMAGGIAVIGDVYKTDVYRLAREINREREIIPEKIITKPPSAELRPDQLDTDSLPEYDILDSILYQYIELNKPADGIVLENYDRSVVDKVLRLVNYNEYKRHQAPPVLRISSKAFGDGRKMPIVAKY